MPSDEQMGYFTHVTFAASGGVTGIELPASGPLLVRVQISGVYGLGEDERLPLDDRGNLDALRRI